MERLLSRSEPSHRSAAAVSYPRKEAATGTFRYLEDSTLKKKTENHKKKPGSTALPTPPVSLGKVSSQQHRYPGEGGSTRV